MTVQRPDLSSVDPSILQYIESLENELKLLRRNSPDEFPDVEAASPEPPEQPTTISVITATAQGNAKRTLRHLYTRQRRGGMGIYDLDDPDDKPPAILTLADVDQTLLLLTDQGRAFQLPMTSIPETPVRGRAASIIGRLNLAEDERLAAILPIQAQGYLAIISQRGMVRLLRHHVFGEYMKPGMAFYDMKSFGPLAAACWSPGECDLFIATRQGRAIRFAEKLVPPQGCLAIRLVEDDTPVAITAVYEDSGVFLLGADGRGTIRDMRGFNPNKAPGAGGKAAMASDNVISAAVVNTNEDIFIISHLSKIIRFRVEEVPVKEGVVQGVNCMAFRADTAVASTVAAL
jgi:DNA gyrase subunit A